MLRLKKEKKSNVTCNGAIDNIMNLCPMLPDDGDSDFDKDDSSNASADYSMMSNKSSHGLILQDDVKEVRDACVMLSCILLLSHDLHYQLYRQLEKLFSLDQYHFNDLQID